ncbi:MAG: sodium:proton antiporter [Streptomycetaceae bacterium]|jgi:multicomponent Na+:H+ antiporter subunit B|nr:sodium:proton antiporter [Streptomycetaceae bacterium]
MKPRVRLALFGTAAAVTAGWLAAAGAELPRFGGDVHPYGDRAVAAALARRTANVVSSVNFDQRAFDTLGEESILFAAVLGAGMLLRLARDEHKARPAAARVVPATRLFGALMLPVTLLTGMYIVAHGQLSPGGGFQGGVVLATGLHLAYIAADYRVLERVRPLAVLDVADAAAAGAYSALGLVGLAMGGTFLANTLPLGTFNTLTSGGIVPLINAAVGIEVASGVIVLLARFLDQAVEVTDTDGER